MLNIDNTDLEILDFLREDGRMPYAVIAKNVNLTSTAVSQRVRKMMNDGVITGFSTITNREKLGINIQVMMTVKMIFSKIEAFYKILPTFDEVEFCHRITGEDCIIMKVNLKNNNHLLDFINQVSVYGITKTNVIIEQVV